MQEYNETLELLSQLVRSTDDERKALNLDKVEVPSKKDRLNRWIDVIDQ